MSDQRGYIAKLSERTLLVFRINIGLAPVRTRGTKPAMGLRRKNISSGRANPAIRKAALKARKTPRPCCARFSIVRAVHRSKSGSGGARKRPRSPLTVFGGRSPSAASGSDAAARAASLGPRNRHRRSESG